MSLESDLAARLLDEHPVNAARVLESLPPEGAAEALAELGSERGAAVLRAMAAPAGAGLLRALPAGKGAAFAAALPREHAALLFRRLEEPERQRLLEGLAPSAARALGTLLRFREHTAGALMDPDVLALHAELTAEESLARVRDAARDARYNVYALDAQHVLVGVVNLRELLMAAPEAKLESFMKRRVRSLPADADRRAILTHPGWREAHALPVVDERGVYLGAVRYRTLRRLEEELRGPVADSNATAEALGELFRAGAAGMLEAVSASLNPSGVRRGIDGK